MNITCDHACYFICFFDSLIYKLFKFEVFINKNSQVFLYLYTLMLPAIHKIFELWILFDFPNMYVTL